MKVKIELEDYEYKEMLENKSLAKKWNSLKKEINEFIIYDHSQLPSTMLVRDLKTYDNKHVELCPKLATLLKRYF